MMSYGIMKAFDNKNIDAVKILLLSVKLMYDTKVRLIHEGIRQLLVILEEENLVLYAMVKLAYETQMDERFLKKSSCIKLIWEFIHGRIFYSRLMNYMSLSFTIIRTFIMLILTT